jgi:hypothetical protein
MRFCVADLNAGRIDSIRVRRCAIVAWLVICTPASFGTIVQAAVNCTGNFDLKF